MPQDEYFCHACKRPFSKTLTPAEYEQGASYARHCSGEEVEQHVSAFCPISGKETA